MVDGEAHNLLATGSSPVPATNLTVAASRNIRRHNQTTMSCNCSKAKKLPSCIGTLIIGDVADGAQNYNVYLRTPDGRTDVYPAVDVIYTDLLGIEEPELRVGTQYEVWIAKTNAASINERTAFTPVGASASVTCVTVEFEYCSAGLTTQTITLE